MARESRVFGISELDAVFTSIPFYVLIEKFFCRVFAKNSRLL
jgi:hypothetical protein